MKFNIKQWQDNYLNEDKYKNDTKGYIDDVLSKMSRRELERTHGEYYFVSSASFLRQHSDEKLMKDIIAGRYGRLEAQHWSRHIDML